MICHQRRIRDHLAAQDPRPSAATLDGYTIETISREEARPIIMRYEWLGTMGRPKVIVGLLSPTRGIEGVACFGWGPSGPIRQLIGEPALCLERGACVHYAPDNAASFLINNACKLVYRVAGIPRFFAYGDPAAGEYGAVYQAAGWLYLGQGLDGKNGRSLRYALLRPGDNPDDPGAWTTSRALRRSGQRMSIAEAKARGWQVAWRPAKHVYATHVGRGRRAWRKTLAAKPYPAPHPELKLRQEALPTEAPGTPIFRRIVPPTIQRDLWPNES
jgi:hypothetical protein